MRTIKLNGRRGAEHAARIGRRKIHIGFWSRNLRDYLEDLIVN
jgi:hypothetical protein